MRHNNPRVFSRIAHGFFALMLILTAVSAIGLSTVSHVAAADGTPSALVDSPTMSGSMSTADAEAKCAWLKEQFPQTDAEVRAFGAELFGVPESRISPTTWRCTAESTAGVFDGFVVLGPREAPEGVEYGIVTGVVPNHGVIASYSTECGASYIDGEYFLYRGDPAAPSCDDTYWAISGTVMATRVTYYPFNDLDGPGPNDTFDPGDPATTTKSEGGNAETTEVAGTTTDWCMTVTDLMKTDEYTGVFTLVPGKQTIDVTKWGGAVVEVMIDSTIPPTWVGMTAGPKLTGGNPIKKGEFLSLFPPENAACRTKIGAAI